MHPGPAQERARLRQAQAASPPWAIELQAMDRTPAPLTTSWPLGLAHSITVRPIRPEDEDIEIEFIRCLSPESLYNRIFSNNLSLGREQLDRLTQIDFTRDMAIIATVTLGDRETQIGVTRYVRLEDGSSCEFAIAVADQWQGCGIGVRLLRELIAIAARSGIKQIVGDVLSTNAGMLALARKVGMRVHAHPDGATLRRVVLDIPSADIPRGDACTLMVP
jgi:acetyltransferase